MRVKGYGLTGKGTKTVFELFMVGVFLSVCAGNVFCQEEKYELVIKVKPNTIAMPGNQVAKVPVGAARFRSTELRKLNEEFNALTVEKVFKIKSTPTQGQGLGLKGYKDTEEESGPPDLARIFTQEIKKEKEKEGAQTIEVNNTFLLTLSPKGKVNMKRVAKRYKKLDAVTFAEYVVRKK